MSAPHVTLDKNPIKLEPKLCTLFYTPIKDKSTWLFPAIACLDLKLGKDPPYHLWCSFYGICASEKGASSKSSVERRMAAHNTVAESLAESSTAWTAGRTTRDWSRVYGPSSKGIRFLGNPAQPPKKLIGLKELSFFKHGLFIAQISRVKTDL